MKSKFYLSLLTAIFLLTSFNSFGQASDDPVVNKIVTGLDKWLIDHQPEKVYLQTDKPYYAAGDDIWFKAYVTVGNDHRLSILSGALNVELIDSRDSIKRWIKLPMDDGTTWGDIALPDTLPAGNYRLRAYTNWMRNAGPAYYFYKELSIGTNRSVLAQNNQTSTTGKEQGKTIKNNRTINNVDLQFFPEGGDLVNGLTSKVAFKAIDKNGLDVVIKGEIIDNENNKVAEFATQHFGMGTFIITPEKGKTYKAVVTYADGSVANINLPLALNNGYVLNIDNTDDDNIHVKVTASNAMTSAGQVYIFAQCGGETRFVVKSKAGESTFGATIPKSKFLAGIVQFTLFSAAGDPLNERIAFIQHEEDQLSLNVKADKAVSATSEKVTISLDAQNDSDKAVIGSFSASVIDESKIQTNEDAETTILSQLLLTSDLRGYIEQPNYYFTTDNDTTTKNLDILMLTQGYRRFEWKSLLAGTLAPAVYQPEKLIKISGNVKTLLGNKPVPKAKVILLTSGAESMFMLDTLADDKGNFTFPSLFLKDSINFIIQGRTPKDGKKVTITLDDNGNEDLDTKSKYFMPPAFGLNEDLANYLAANKKLYDEEAKYALGNHTRVLQEVKVVAKPKTTIDFSNNLNGPGKADQVITSAILEQHGGCAFLNDCLQGLISGVVFRNGQAYLTSNGPIAAPFGKPSVPMTIILDGVPVTDFSTIPPEEVGTIEVLKWPQYTAIYGSKGLGGVLVITTKHASEATNYKQVPVGSAFYSPKGYYRVRTFYSPQYDDPKTNRSIADLRSTIFWKPNIVTDKAGHASFEYYNAGEKGTYRITIEGIDIDGNLGRKVYRYKVE